MSGPASSMGKCKVVIFPTWWMAWIWPRCEVGMWMLKSWNLDHFRRTQHSLSQKASWFTHQMGHKCASGGFYFYFFLSARFVSQGISVVGPTEWPAPILRTCEHVWSNSRHPSVLARIRTHISQLVGLWHLRNSVRRKGQFGWSTSFGGTLAAWWTQSHVAIWCRTMWDPHLCICSIHTVHPFLHLILEHQPKFEVYKMLKKTTPKETVGIMTSTVETFQGPTVMFTCHPECW